VERINPAVGVVTAAGEGTCVLETGADTIDSLAVHLGLLGYDFEVVDPPELVAHLRELATRYQRATTVSAPGEPARAREEAGAEPEVVEGG
jgi:WYL domain-containing protein